MSIGTQIYPDMTLADLPATSGGYVPFAVPGGVPGYSTHVSYRVDLSAKFLEFVTLVALAASNGSDLVGTATGTLTAALATIADEIATLEAEIAAITTPPVPRSRPTAAFSVLPILPTVVGGVGNVSFTESPIDYAIRTYTYTGAAEVTWVTVTGSDTTGLGTFASPFRTPDHALSASTTSRIKVGAGRYPPFSERIDTNPTGSARLRRIEAQGPVTIANQTDDLSGRSGLATFSGLPTAGQVFAINGLQFIFRAAAALSNEVTIGADGPATAINLATVINANRPSLGVIAGATGSVVELTLSPGRYSADGAAISLYENASNLTASGSSTSATGAVTFTGLPTAAETVTINGFILTFRAAAGSAYEITIGADATATAVNLVATINRLPALNVSASNAAGVVTLVSTLYGTQGNATTLTEAATNTSVSGATLTGGVNTWTNASGQMWDFPLTPGNFPPRAVLDLSRRDPTTGYPVPLTRYANSILYTFAGQPANNDTATINGIVWTFKTTASASRDVQIGATKEDTVTNFTAKVNGESETCAVLADQPAANTVRCMARIDAASQTVTGSASGANPGVGSMVTGATNLDDLALGNNINGDNGGWYYDAAGHKLRIRRATNTIENFRTDFKLIVSSAADTDNRCFFLGSIVSFEGDISWEGTYIYGLNNTTTRAQILSAVRNFDRPTFLCSPPNAPGIELDGCLAVLQGMTGAYCSIDTFHINSSALPAWTQALDCESAWDGDPFTFPVVDFPNKNGISPHGVDAITAILGGKYQLSIGPDITGEGLFWIVALQASDSQGVDNSYEFEQLSGGIAYIDTCSFTGGANADISAINDSTIYHYRTGYRTTNIEAGSSFLPWVPS